MVLELNLPIYNGDLRDISRGRLVDDLVCTIYTFYSIQSAGTYDRVVELVGQVEQRIMAEYHTFEEKGQETDCIARGNALRDFFLRENWYINTNGYATQKNGAHIQYDQMLRAFAMRAILFKESGGFDAPIYGDGCQNLRTSLRPHTDMIGVKKPNTFGNIRKIK